MSYPSENIDCDMSGSNVSVRVVAMSNDGKIAQFSKNQSPSTFTLNNPAGDSAADLSKSKSLDSYSSSLRTQPPGDEECSLSIIYGNEAQYVAEASHLPQLPEGHTHRWTVYVRAYKEYETAALAKIIRKVMHNI